MSAGELPLETYHRASSVGAGTFGSVVVVYNDDGEEWALKLFTDDDEEEENDDDETDPPMDLGAMREISILRLLRGTANRFQCIEMHDVSPEWMDDEDEGGAGTAGTLGMAMPLFSGGSLGGLLESPNANALTKAHKAHIAHDLLTAVAFLHANGICHRDIKTDNVLLTYANDENNSQTEPTWRAVLTDFSLAKPMDYSIYKNSSFSHEQPEEEPRHTATIGTMLYNAPEVVDATEEYYDPRAVDMWSTGVVLLEVLVGASLGEHVNKAKQVEPALREALQKLPANQPFPALVHQLLQELPEDRLSAKEALGHALFTKFGLLPPNQYDTIHIAKALPFDEEDDPQTRKRLEKRWLKIVKACKVLGSEKELTRQAALEYTIHMEELDDELDSPESQVIADCAVMAHRFLEVDYLDLGKLDDMTTGIFADWTKADYLEFESSLFMLLDFCLYPRRLRQMK